MLIKSEQQDHAGDPRRATNSGQRSCPHRIRRQGPSRQEIAQATYWRRQGLSALVLDCRGFGGQAGVSARIENYLGFPTGITGMALMARAYNQAQKFGVETAIPDEAVAFEAPTTDTSSSSSSDQSPILPASTTPVTDQGTATSTQSAPAPAQSAALSLTLVHTAGTKYVDYCTDGKKETAYPGDPSIDAHFDVPDAPTPHCPDGQTWDHTSGMPAYDTQSGDLEVNQYAQQADGTYVVRYPAMTYTDATSTKQWPDRITSVATDPSTTPLPEGVTLTPATQ
jgi:hypothetical protein